MRVLGSDRACVRKGGKGYVGGVSREPGQMPAYMLACQHVYYVYLCVHKCHFSPTGPPPTRTPYPQI